MVVVNLSKGKALAFHSYKGGTGKTTLVTNLAATFASSGMRVCLLDVLSEKARNVSKRSSIWRRNYIGHFSQC